MHMTFYGNEYDVKVSAGCNTRYHGVLVDLEAYRPRLAAHEHDGRSSEDSQHSLAACLHHCGQLNSVYPSQCDELQLRGARMRCRPVGGGSPPPPPQTPP